VANGNDEDAFGLGAADEARDLHGAILPGTTKYGIQVYSVKKKYRNAEFYLESGCGDIDFSGGFGNWGQDSSPD